MKVNLHNIILVILSLGLFTSCSSSTKTKKEQVVSKIHPKIDSENNDFDSANNDSEPDKMNYTNKEILDLIEGKYEYIESYSKSKLELDLKLINEKLNYHLKTQTRNINGFAEVSINKYGSVFIFFPIEFDLFEGDLTVDGSGYKGEKPKQVSMSFDPKYKTIMFQNYGNAMNSYTIFDEFEDKLIQINRITEK
jgi:hypothetical protein